MTTQIKRRRGTTVEHASFTGAEGEITIDTTKDTAVVHDGVLAGGHPLAKENGSTFTNVDINSGTIDGVTIGGASAGAITGTTITGTSFVTSGDMTFGDNDKAIFGAGSDLQIYHTGSNSIIDDLGTGNLLIRSDGAAISLQVNSKNSVRAVADEDVELYYNGNEKLATTATGIDVTGTVTADGLTVDASSPDVVIKDTQTHTTTDGPLIQFQGRGPNATNYNFGYIQGLSNGTNNAGDVVIGTNTAGVQYQRMRLEDNGDISFYEDTGTTPKLFWDASAESLGIGTTSPSVGGAYSANNTLTIFGGTNSGSEDTAYVEIGSSTNVNGYQTGGIAFYNNDNSGAGPTTRKQTAIIRALSVTSDSNAGDDSGGDLQFLTKSEAGSLAEAMRIDSSGNVKIGDATTDVTSKLTVSGNATADVATFMYDGTAGTFLDINCEAANGSVILKADARSGAYPPITFVTGNTERMRIDSAGNLGLGVTPSAWAAGFSAFQFSTGGVVWSNGNNSSIGSNHFYNGSNYVYKNTDFASRLQQLNGQFQFFTAASGTAGNAITFTQAMTLDASGNLGIGTTSPANLLHVNGSNSVARFSGASTALSAYQTFFNNSAAQAYFGIESSSGTGIIGTGAAYGMVLTTASTNPLCFGTNGAERARIDSSGNLLVGTTTSNGTNAEGFNLYNAASGGSRLYIGHEDVPNGTQYVAFNYNGTKIGDIVQSGTTAVLYNTSSDYRLKDITGPITTSGDYIDSLNPVEGTWKADGSTFVGLIAHEVQEVSRTNVATGEKDGEEMQGMDYSSAEIIANLIAEVKALRQRVATLETLKGA